MNKALIVVVLATVALMAYWYWPDTAETISVTPPDLPQQEAPPNATFTTTVPEPLQQPEIAKSEDCLNQKQLEEHPLLMQEAARMQAISVAGPDIDVYREVDVGSLEAYALQGDSAAMSVIGARAVMRAFGKDERQAIPWLQSELGGPEYQLFLRSFSPEAMLELNEAAHWFYQSALYGRIFAFTKYGLVRGAQFGGPVEMGWISKEDFDALDKQEQDALVPLNLYNNLIGDIAPQLASGGIMAEVMSIGPRSELQESIRQDLRAQFESDLAEAGLPPVSVAELASFDLSDLAAQVCAPIREEHERRRSIDERN